MSDPLVSVVIATYNMGQYLADAARSVLGQTWTNLELIIVDDGSTDGTSDTVKALLGDARLRYIRQENAGQPKAKNRGLKECKGDFIAFCDGDDLWEPTKLADQMPLMLSNPDVGVVYSRVSYMGPDGEYLREDAPLGFSGQVTHQMIMSNFVPFGTALIRRQALETCGIFDESLPMGIDWDLWLRISTRWKFAYLPTVTYRYREWPGQMSKNYRGRYLNAFRIMEKFFSSFPDAVPPHLRRRALSDTYANKGWAIARGEGRCREAVHDCLRAVLLAPSYLKAWKTLLKVVVGRV